MVDENSAIGKLGQAVDTVVLDIDYQIIEHFSRHLYGSANKAIEELVANGFDAYAQSVRVYLPGALARDYVAVWDDGWSMDIDGLKELWKIASSPKERVDRVAKGPRGPRKMIGKFGIGKLASYTIGNTITHLCRNDDKFLSVSVDYRDVHPENGGGSVTTRDPLKAPIRSLSELEAKTLVEEVFPKDGHSEVLDLFDCQRWTLAVIGSLKGKEIQRGRLVWVLGNGMPLRPDFRVFVNDEVVGRRVEKAALEQWDFGDEAVTDVLRQSWQKALNRGEIGGELSFGAEDGLDTEHPELKIPYVWFPELGWVWGSIRLFNRSLLDARTSEYGRSHGFFIMVRGRLLNTDDSELFLKPPSYGTFYRSQFVLNIDGLDDELLADRSRLQQDTSKATELAVLQQAVYLAARTYLDNSDAQQAEERKHLATLPTRSRAFYREPVTALLAMAGSDSPVDFRITRPKVERQALGADAPLARLSPSGDGFQVNASHPYYQVLEKRLGKTKKAQEFYRVYDLFAVSELLLKGHLFDLGIPESQIAEIFLWREGLFRELSRAYEIAPSDLAMDLVNTSYTGGKAFENSLAANLNSMGFVAEHRGASGKEDIFLLATIGPETYSIVFEAKGSIKKISNDDAELAGAAAHREQIGAEWAVVVARDFKGFDERGAGDPAILKECRAVGRVSIMTVDAVNALSAVVEEFAYPLDLLKDVFVTIESPLQKAERIEGLRAPTKDFDYKKVLDKVWSAQQAEAQGDQVAYRPIWQSDWRSIMNLDQFEQRLVALETLAAGRIRVMTGAQTLHLLQSPSIVVDAIEASLKGAGYSYRLKG